MVLRMVCLRRSALLTNSYHATVQPFGTLATTKSSIGMEEARHWKNREWQRGLEATWALKPMELSPKSTRFRDIALSFKKYLAATRPRTMLSKQSLLTSARSSAAIRRGIGFGRVTSRP